MSGKTKRLLFAFLLSAIVLALHAFFYQISFFRELDYTLLDFWFRARGPVPPPQEVVLITMDEGSYQNLGIPYDQAWPRKIHAQLLEKLAKAGVTRVAFDVLFLEQSSDERADEALEKALSKLPVVIGADQGMRETQYGYVEEFLMPYEKFSKVAEPAMVGLPEEVGYVRHFRLMDSSDLEDSPRPLAFAAADINLKDKNPGPRDLINFYGPASYMPSYSYYQILEEEVPFPLERLKGKIVFVGLELRSELGPQQKDSFLTSYDENGRHFGVEIHATAAANLLTKNWISRLPLSAEILLLTILLTGICIACITLQPLRSASISLSAGVLWLIASFVAFKNNIFLPGAPALIIFAPTIYIVSTLLFYLVTRKHQKKLRKAFELYISPHMANQVTRDPSALGLGGQKVFATAVFTDIAGFTTISESMSAEEVTQMLNDYFSEIVDIIFEEKGTLIKFIGDAVFALWGSPVKLEHHAQAALEAGLAIIDKLKNAESLKKYPPLHTRIGIHSGYMVVGNLGSRKRFDFTAIGDSVNLASRVEGLNKYLGTSILITESVKNQLHKPFDVLCMGKVKVVGKSEAVTLYTVQKDVPLEIRTRWEEALSEFQIKDWEKAEKNLNFCAERSLELKKAAEFYIEQLTNYRVIPPKEGWNGELVLDTK